MAMCARIVHTLNSRNFMRIECSEDLSAKLKGFRIYSLYIDLNKTDKTILFHAKRAIAIELSAVIYFVGLDFHEL